MARLRCALLVLSGGCGLFGTASQRVGAGADAPASECPLRTAPPGQPEGMVPLSAVHDGDYMIASYLDVEALAGIRVITGSLIVTSPATTSGLALPDLEVIGGNFTVNDFSGELDSITLPALQTTGGGVAITAANAATLDLGQLDSVGADFDVAVAAPTVSASCLRSIGSDLAVAGTTTVVAFPRVASAGYIRLTGSSLTSLALPVLTAAGGISVMGSNALGTISMPALPSTGDIAITNDAALTSISLDQLVSAGSLELAAPQLIAVTTPSLTMVGASLAIGGTNLADLDAFAHVTTVVGTLDLEMNPALTSLGGLDQLTSVGSITITFNSVLTTLGLTGLTTVTGTGGGAGIQYNPMLPTCQVTALDARVMKQLAGPGNDDTATCP